MASFGEVVERLQFAALTEMFEEYGRQAPPNPFFDFYTRGTPTDFPADQVQFVALQAIRSAAPLNLRGSPARMLQPTGKQIRSLTMMRMFNAVQLSMDAVQMLRKPDQYAYQQKGFEEVSQQMEDAGTRCITAKQLTLAKSFAGGAVYVGAQGQILESSSGAVYTIDLGIPAANKAQLARSAFFSGGSGNIIAQSWDDPTALILDQLDELYDGAARTNVAPPRHVWLFRSNKKWLRNNLQIQKLYNFQVDSNRLDNTLKDDQFEINNYVFHFYGGTYQPSTGGALIPFIPDTMAIITPEPGPWFANGRGMEYVPQRTGLVESGSVEGFFNPSSLTAALASLDEVYGDFGYVEVAISPTRLNLFSGSNWLYGFKQPNYVFCPTVKF